MYDQDFLFSEAQSSEFQNLALENGFILVGATNVIMRLSTDLERFGQFINGPQNDSSQCLRSILCPDNACTGLTCTNNYNTLLIAYSQSILACGTLGRTCDLLNASDISLRVGSEQVLKCTDETNAQFTDISSRDRNLSFVAAVYESQAHPSKSILYLGKSYHAQEISSGSITALIAPDFKDSYFSLIDDSELYVMVNNRRPVYHFAWTDEKYAYIIWSNLTNPQIKLSRYCNSVMADWSREDSYSNQYFAKDQGQRSYTEITLICTSSGQNLTNLISAKVTFGRLYLLFQSDSNAVICSATVPAINEHIDFIRKQCWNTSVGPNYAEPLDPTGSECFNVGGYQSQWVSGITKAVFRVGCEVNWKIYSFRMFENLNFYIQVFNY